MTRDDLVRRLEAVKHCIYHPHSQAAEDEAERAIDDAIAALAAPPAAPPTDLVALVREWQEAAKDEARYLCGPEPESPARVFDIHERKRAAKDGILAYPLPAAPRVPDTPQGCAATPPPVICCCETCGIRLEEDFGTYVTGVRAGAAWRCAVCLPIEGPSGRLLRDVVVRERRKRSSKSSTPPQEPPR